MHSRHVGTHARKLYVLVIQLTKLRKMRDRCVEELALRLVVRQLVDAVLPARITDLGTLLDLL